MTILNDCFTKRTDVSIFHALKEESEFGVWEKKSNGSSIYIPNILLLNSKKSNILKIN